MSKGQLSQTQCVKICIYANGQRQHVAHRMGYFSFETGVCLRRVDKREKLDFVASIVDAYATYLIGVQRRTRADGRPR